MAASVTVNLEPGHAQRRLCRQLVPLTSYVSVCPYSLTMATNLPSPSVYLNHGEFNEENVTIEHPKSERL
jgi:hypothetical protein